MSKWSIKGILSRLGSGSQEADALDDESADVGDDEEIAGDLSMPGSYVSPLAMMDERRPEAWLGNFLAIIGAPPAISYSTLARARQDENLRTHLEGVWAKAVAASAARMLDPSYVDALKSEDWSAWWRAQEELGRYAYSVLALALLGSTKHNTELVDLYRQEGNSRIQKDAHYTLCFVLAKGWPDYRPTEADLARLVSYSAPA